MGGAVDVHIASTLTAAAARERLRQEVRVETLAEKLEFGAHDRILIGWVAEPRFEVTMVGPSPQGRVGPVRLRAPYRSRRLVGTIVDAPAGGSIIEGRFRPRAPSTMARRRREEQRLVQWFTAVLFEGGDGRDQLGR